MAIDSLCQLQHVRNEGILPHATNNVQVTAVHTLHNLPLTLHSTDLAGTRTACHVR